MVLPDQEKMMKHVLTTFLILLAASPSLADEARDAKQARLDAACEAARQEKLAPLRQKYVDECVASKELPSRQECERFYADYGERTGRKAPLFYDLPACVTAFNFQQGNADPQS
jgi:uncharacterized protein YgiB involved in biofilm formation